MQRFGHFHPRVREAIAAGTIKVAKEGTQTNMANILTKLMPGSKVIELLERILWLRHGNAETGTLLAIGDSA